MSIVNNTTNFYLNNQIQDFNPVTPAEVRKAIMAEIPAKLRTKKSRDTRLPAKALPANANVKQIQRAAEKAFKKGNVNLGTALNNLRITLQNGDRKLDVDGNGKLTISIPGKKGLNPANRINELTAFSQIAGTTQNGMNNYLDITDFGYTNLQPLLPQSPSLPTEPTLPNAGIDPNLLLSLMGNNSGINPYATAGNCTPFSSTVAPITPQQPSASGVNIINNFSSATLAQLLLNAGQTGRSF